MADCINCKYCKENHNDKLICTKVNAAISGDGCPKFEQTQFCNTCKYAKVMVYETGTIDCIDYRCMLQNNKFIYSDNNPMRCKNALYPECNIGLYEEM